jgi:hypothetical protein
VWFTDLNRVQLSWTSLQLFELKSVLTNFGSNWVKLEFFSS